MANTLPNGVVESSNVDPASLGGFAYASSVRQTYKVANLAALNALGDMETGDLGYLQDTAAYYYFNGTNWIVWYTTRPLEFNPIWQGINIGNGTQNYARLTTVGSQTTAEVALTFGSTTSITGAVSVSYPSGANIAGLQEFQPVGDTWFYSTTFGYTGVASHRTDGRVVLDCQAIASGSGTVPVRHVGINSTFPFTWTTGNKITARWSWLT